MAFFLLKSSIIQRFTLGNTDHALVISYLRTFFNCQLIQISFNCLLVPKSKMIKILSVEKFEETDLDLLPFVNK